MGDGKTNYHEYFDKNTKTEPKRRSTSKTVSVPKESRKSASIFVKAKSLPVRIRKQPDLNAEVISDRMVRETPVEIVEIEKGYGSETGWGKLADGDGWVSMDHVIEVRFIN